MFFLLDYNMEIKGSKFMRKSTANVSQILEMDTSYIDCSGDCELSSICMVDHSLPVWSSQACSCSASPAANAIVVHMPTQPFVTIRIKNVGSPQLDGRCSVCKPPCAILLSYCRPVPLCALDDVPSAGTFASRTVSDTKDCCPVCPSQERQV